jgi:hypothetical protein
MMMDDDDDECVVVVIQASLQLLHIPASARNLIRSRVPPTLPPNQPVHYLLTIYISIFPTK